MATNSLPAYGFTLTLPNTTTVVAVDDIQFGASAIAVPDNCRTIVVFNTDDTNRILVKFTRPPAVLASMVIASCTVIPAAGSMSFDVGYLTDRGEISPTGSCNIYMVAETGNTVPVNVTYLMGRGSTTP